MNKVIEIGRTTKGIELKTTASGKSIVSFTLAVNRDYKNANGEYDCDFLDCVAFDKLAETISRYVHKSDMVGVTGRLQTRNYKDKVGNSRKATEIIVKDIEFLQSKKQEPVNEEPADEFEEVDPFGDLPF